jgi:hypothetical protein
MLPLLKLLLELGAVVVGAPFDTRVNLHGQQAVAGKILT